ncbi:MAG TPA: hypothetical protein VFZ52_25125, partial [Chryseolinea sp.]
LAVPTSYLFISQWLDSFTYRINVGVIPFLAGGVLMIITVLLTIMYETLKSVNVNPVEKLRNE